MNENVSFNISQNEALVLFDFLARFNQADNQVFFEDQAEQRVLWDLEAILEGQLTQPFLENYTVLLEEAREAIRDN